MPKSTSEKNQDIAYGLSNNFPRLLREFYRRFEASPANRALVKFARQELGPDKGRSVYLMSLFPGSPAKLGSKIAGLPKPDNCL